MVTIALCMIAKDEEKLITGAITSVKSVVDEIIVCVDTRTKDNTKKLAQAAGATVHDYIWQNDFAVARNNAIAKAKSEWILCLDADERIAKTDLADLRTVIVNDEKKEIVAFSFFHRYYTNQKDAHVGWKSFGQKEKSTLIHEFTEFEPFNGYFDIFPVTYFFRNHPKIMFRGKIHEDVQPSIAAWNNEEPQKIIVQTTIPIHHAHFLKHKTYVNTKQEYYFNLSKEKYKMHPDAKIALDIAVGYIFFHNDKKKSFHYLLEALKHENANEHHIKKIEDLLKQNKEIPALHCIMNILDIKKRNMNDIFNLVKAYYNQQEYKLALVVLKKVLVVAPNSPITIEYMAACYDQIQLYTDAIKVLEHGITVHPTNAQFYFNLGALYEKVKDYGKAIAAFQYAINNNHPAREGLKKRIVMLRNILSGNHVTYNINVGDAGIDNQY